MYVSQKEMLEINSKNAYELDELMDGWMDVFKLRTNGNMMISIYVHMYVCM